VLVYYRRGVLFLARGKTLPSDIACSMLSTLPPEFSSSTLHVIEMLMMQM
jgi:hypothetical protein